MEFVFAATVVISKREKDVLFRKRRQESLDKIARGLAERGPVRRTDAVTFSTDDYRFGFWLRDWLKQEGFIGGIVHEDAIWELASLFRARYVRLNPDRDELEDDPVHGQLNVYPSVLCKRCGRPDYRAVEGPFKVSGVGLRRNQEVYNGGHGRLIVNARVLELLRRAVGDQIESGECQIVGKTPPDCPKSVFWVLPKHETPPNLESVALKKCPACGVRLGSMLQWTRETIGSRVTLERFGDENVNIAILPNWFGGRDDDAGTFPTWHRSVISGELLAYLLANNVKGLWIPQAGVFSNRVEPPIETKRRFPELLPEQILQSAVKKFKGRARGPGY